MKPIITLYIALLSCCIACAQKKEKHYSSPNGYDFNRPEKKVFPNILEEVSGITFVAGKPHTLYAQQDEKGMLFYLNLVDMKPQSVKFGGAGDYEDLAVHNSHVIMLRSDGTFYTFPFRDSYANEIKARKIEKLIPKGEYESLAADSKKNQLYVLCKQCNVDKKTASTTGYLLYIHPDGTLSKQGSFAISSKEISTFVDLRGKAFRPSALSKNKKSDEWYILSSINKMLVVTDANWHVKAVHALDPKLFNQPEGITFDQENNLYISNEAGNTGKATLLKFVYQDER